jgi:hypothetical protein
VGIFYDLAIRLENVHLSRLTIQAGKQHGLPGVFWFAAMPSLGLGRTVAEDELIGIVVRVHAVTSSPQRNSSAPPSAVIARRIE